MTAVDISGNESGYSAEVSKTIPSSNNYIPLPAPDSYGMIKGGDQSHVNEVDSSFSGSGGNLTASCQAWDVDHNKEVQVVLNGHVLEYAQKTGNENWGKSQTLFLPDQYVNDTDNNILKFNNTGNPPNTYWWGVRNISLTTGSETKGLRKGRKKRQQ